MTHRDDRTVDASESRRRAEPLWQESAPARKKHTSRVRSESLREPESGLEVRQLELEMQREAAEAEGTPAEASDVTRSGERAIEVERERVRYRELFQRAPVGQMVLRRDGTLVSVNLRGAALLGIDGAEGWGPLEALVSAPDRTVLRQLVDDALATEGTVAAELTLLGGRRIGLEATRGANAGECQLCAWPAAETYAARSTSVGVAVADPRLPNTPIVHTNPGFEQMTGYAAEDLGSKNWTFFRGRDTDPKSARELQEAVSEGRACTTELLLYRKDGSPYRCLLNLAPVHDETNRVTAIVGTQIDITAHREKTLAADQSLRMEAIGRLAGGMAHEFNNLLTVINAYSEALLADFSDGALSDGRLAPGGSDGRRVRDREAALESLLAIRDAGARAAELTRQLTGFGRRHMTNPKELRVSEELRTMDAALRRVLGEGFDLKVSAAPENAHVKMDAGQLERVLVNLVVNARDAMPRGGTITVGAEQVELDEAYCATREGLTPGPHVRLTVSDTGVGMDAATRARIFEPFFTTKEVGSGTGLGLSTAYWIVKRSKGEISVESEEGRGSTFQVLLPAATAPAPRLAKVTVTPVLRGNETVLLVEDEPAVRELIRRVLSRFGYFVLTAGNGEEALRVLAAHRGAIHVLLTDVVMPVMGGRVLAERVRELRPEVSVLFMSGYTEDVALLEGVRRSEADFIQKPFTPDALAERLREVLDGAATPLASRMIRFAQA